MNRPETQNLIRQDLQRAIAQHGAPPKVRPMDASPWVAMSAMQKAIRRGREDLALGAAATLLRDGPERLWRRLGSTASEDVGLASLDTVGIATAALGGKRVREELGGEWAVASYVVSALAQAAKCRAADDLLMSSALHPAYVQARADLPHLTTRDLMALAAGQGSIHERALALWYVIGTDRRSPSLAIRRGEPRLVFDFLCEAGWPRSIVEIAREGLRRTGEPLAPLIALLSREPREHVRMQSDDFPPEQMIGDVPGWALDVYSREGQAAFSAFLQTEARSARWIRQHVRPTRRTSFLGHAVFRVEGGLVANRARWPLGDDLRRQVDYECAGPECPDAAEILALAREDIRFLNEVRAEVTGRKPHGR